MIIFINSVAVFNLIQHASRKSFRHPLRIIEIFCNLVGSIVPALAEQVVAARLVLLGLLLSLSPLDCFSENIVNTSNNHEQDQQEVREGRSSLVTIGWQLVHVERIVRIILYRE